MNISEDGSHSELATTIDHGIAIRLLGLLTDGSPIVRQVIALFSSSFQTFTPPLFSSRN